MRLHEPDWRDDIPGCFGVGEIFMHRKSDQLRALKLLYRLHDLHVPIGEVIDAFKTYLASRRMSASHIERQLYSVYLHFGLWLDPDFIT